MIESRLGDVAHYIRGITFKPEDRVPPHSPGSVICLRTANIQEHLDETSLIAVPEIFVRRTEQHVVANDILVSSANSWNLVGKSVIVPHLSYRATAGGFISILRPDADRVEPRYLIRWLSFGETQAKVRACARQTTNIANLASERFLNLRVPLPPLPEQRRIAAILDKADAILQKRSASLSLSADLLQAAFSVALCARSPEAWPIVDLGSVFARKPQIGTTKPATTDGDVPVVRVGDLGSDEIELKRCGKVSLTARELERALVRSGDLLFVRAIGSASHLGKASLLQPTDSQVVFDSHVMRLTFESRRLEPAFFLVWLRSPLGRSEFMKRARRTAVQFNINAEQVAAIRMPLPPIDWQREFLERAEAIQRLRAKQTSGFAAADNLFQSLLHQSFPPTPS